MKSFDSKEWLRLFAIDYRQCPTCRGCLDGWPDAGNCPECKSPYTYEEVRRYWKRRCPPPVMLADPRAAARNAGLIEGETPVVSEAGNRVQWEVVFVGVCLVSVPINKLLDPAASLGLSPSWNSLTYVIVMALAIFGMGLRRASGHRVIAMDFRCCTRCEFDLRGVDSPGQCPECNRAFSDRFLMTWWRLCRHVPPDANLAVIKERWLAKHPEDRAVSTPADA